MNTFKDSKFAFQKAEIRERCFINKTCRTLKALPILLLVLPVSPAALAATPQCAYGESDGAFNVSWADTSVYKYIVERSVNSSPWYWRGAVLDSDIDSYQFKDNGNAAAPGSSIRYRLQTKAANNSSPLQEPVLCKLTDIERPSEATSIKVDALSSNSLNISWQAASDNVAVDRYLIYRAPADGAVAVKVGETSDLSFTDVGLNPATDYWYYIKAVDTSGNVGWRTGYHFNTTLERPSASERYATANVGGRWEIIDADSGNVARWNAVNVRTDKLDAFPLGAEDIQALSMVFNTIRLSVHWDDLHDGPGRFDQALKQRVKTILDYAKQNEVDVILEPVHLGGDNNFWMPDWLWRQRGFSLDVDNRKNSFELLKSDEIHQYLNWVMGESGLGSHPAVVAIEVVNEPHPDKSIDAWKYEVQRELMLAYKPMVATIRQYRPDVIVVLNSYYGGHLFDNGLGEGNAIADVFSGTPNLIWAAHNYFTGIELPPRGPDYDGDGNIDNDGQGYRGTRGAGLYKGPLGSKENGTWPESYKSSGCYAQIQPIPSNDFSQCDTNWPRRNEALKGHANNAANHDRVAQLAGMPFFMGEFGIGRVRDRDNKRVGWMGSNEFMCDKLQAYSDIRLDGSNISISSAVWAFDSEVDGGFGLYSSSTNKWVQANSDAFFGQCP